MDNAMKRTRIACACLFLASSAYADLQFVPHPSTYELDGVKFEQVVFADGNKEVTYGPPRGWDYSGSASKLTMHPKDKPQAEATVIKLPLPEPMTFDDEETLKKLTNEALASVPAGSTQVELLSQEKNSVLIDRKETFLVTMSYTFYGETYGRSVMFLNRGKEQVRFQFVARMADFKELQQAFHRSHFTWQNL
jgi:hypothetical protein